MQSHLILSVLVCGVSAQLAAWPASSYSPFYQALLAPARTPVMSVPFGKGVIPTGVPVPTVLATPPMPMVPTMPMAPVMPMPAPGFVAAPSPLRGPAFNYAPSPVLAQVRPAMITAALPMGNYYATAPAMHLPVAPRMVPAFAPFTTSAMFFGSNKKGLPDLVAKNKWRYVF